MVVEDGADAHFGKACVSEMPWCSIFGEGWLGWAVAEVAFVKAILLN